MRKSFAAALCVLFATAVFADSPVLPPMGLPKEYQQVESLISTGTQYIVNSGYTRNKNTSRIQAVWDAGSDYAGYNNGVCANSYRAIFGEQDSDNSSAFNFRYYNQNNIRDNRTSTIVTKVPSGLSELNVFFDSSATGTWKVVASGKTSNYKFTFGPGGYDSDPKVFPAVEMGVFCNHNSNYPRYNWRYPSAIQLYSLKIWEKDDNGNEVLVRDYVPCFRRSDNAAGLFDATGKTENGLFRSNQSTLSGEQQEGKDIDFEVGSSVTNVNKIIITNTMADVPVAAGVTPTCGMHDLTPGESFTASVTNPSVLNPGKTLRYTVTGWEKILRNASGTTVISNGIDNVSTCTFTPADGDEVYLTWIWKCEEASSSEFRVRDAAGVIVGTTYNDLATAVAATTNNCTIELLADSAWDAPITITDKRITIKSADGKRYTLSRTSAEACFIVDAESKDQHLPSSDYKDYAETADGFHWAGSMCGYETARLAVTNLIINGGANDGVKGGVLVQLEKGTSISGSRSWEYHNCSGLKLEAGAEICNFETDGDYMIKVGGNMIAFRMNPGAKIHDITGKKGVFAFSDASSSGSYYYFRMLEAEIYNCSVSEESAAVLWMQEKDMSWESVRFRDAVITNNITGSDGRGAVYLAGYFEEGKTNTAFNVGGNVCITDNFLQDGTTPANVRVNKNNTSMDLHQKLGPKAKIGLAYTTGSAKVAAVEGAEIGIVTPTADKGRAKAITYDGNERIFGKIVDQTVLWARDQGLVLIIR